MIEVSGLCKDYGTSLAISDVSFSIGRGEIVGFLGPNGAGKSTTLRIIAGAMGASSGTVSIAGYDILLQPMQARAAIGYMPEATPLYPELLVDEYLLFRAGLKGIARRERSRAVQLALEQANVLEVRAVPIHQLSKGYKQRVGLADALLGAPPVFILDEPTAGLDPNQIRDVRELIKQLGGRHTVLVSSHILAEIEAVCDRALVIHRGRIVAQGTLAELRQIRRVPGLELSVLGAASDLPVGVVPNSALAAIRSLLTPLAGVGRLEPIGPATAPEQTLNFSVSLLSGTSLEIMSARIVRQLVEAGFGVISVKPCQSSLEDVFAQLTQSQPNPGGIAHSGVTNESPSLETPGAGASH